MPVDHDKKIAQAESELEKCLTHMDSLKAEFISATGDALREWFATQTRHEVMKDAEHTTAIGTDGLKTVKEQLAALQDRSATIAAEALDRHIIWYHRSPKQPSMSETVEYDRQLKHLVLVAAGRLSSTVLEPNGYLKDKRAANVANSFNFTKKMTEAWQNYSSSFHNLESCRYKVQDAKRAKAEEHAAGLWDEA